MYVQPRVHITDGRVYGPIQHLTNDYYFCWRTVIVLTTVTNDHTLRISLSKTAQWCRWERWDWRRWNTCGQWLQQQSSIHSSSVGSCFSDDVAGRHYAVSSPSCRSLKPTDVLLDRCSVSAPLLPLLLQMMTLLAADRLDWHDHQKRHAKRRHCETRLSVSRIPPDDHRCSGVPTHISVMQIISLSVTFCFFIFNAFSFSSSSFSLRLLPLFPLPLPHLQYVVKSG